MSDEQYSTKCIKIDQDLQERGLELLSKVRSLGEELRLYYNNNPSTTGLPANEAAGLKRNHVMYYREILQGVVKHLLNDQR
jgi:hypothetical protein